MDRPDSEHTLGSFLRAERERRGITPEQVASATKIAIKYLHALEADQFSDLPAIPFIRGFVTSYARFIGLDPKQTLMEFEKFIQARAQDRPARDGGHSGYAFESKDGEQRTRLMLSVIMGVIVVAGGIVIALKPNLRGHRHGNLDKLRGTVPSPAPDTQGTPPVEGVAAIPSPSPSPSEAPAEKVVAVAPSDKPKPSASPSVTASPTTVAAVTPSASPSPAASSTADPLDSGKDVPLPEVKHKVTVKALADIWVRYRVDEKTVRKFIMRKGATLILRARDRAQFQISNPRGATLNYNGTGTRRVEEQPGLKTFQDTSTLIFPKQALETLGEPFAGEKPLPHTDDPVAVAPSPAPTPDAAPPASPQPELSTGSP